MKWSIISPVGIPVHHLLASSLNSGSWDSSDKDSNPYKMWGTIGLYSEESKSFSHQPWKEILLYYLMSYKQTRHRSGQEQEKKNKEEWMTRNGMLEHLHFPLGLLVCIKDNDIPCTDVHGKVCTLSLGPREINDHVDSSWFQKPDSQIQYTGRWSLSFAFIKLTKKPFQSNWTAQT